MMADNAKIEVAGPDEVDRYSDAGKADSSTPSDGLEGLRSELKSCQDRYLRARAETQNVTRRLTEEKEAVIRYANAMFAKALLPVLDNLERTVNGLTQAHKDDPHIQGVVLTYELLKKTLADQHVEPIVALGKPFDPTLHEAVSRQETNDAPPGTVITEYERGYRLHDRVLRASRVVVSVAPATT